MKAHVPERCTAVLILTGDSGLVRLARSILGPDKKVTAAGRFHGNSEGVLEGADVVIAEFDTIDPEAIAAVRRASPGAALIVLCPERREVDCIAALDMDADYLARSFSSHDLAARVRVAERRRFASTGRPAFYRNGPLVFDLFRRTLSIDGRAVALTPSERAFFAELADRPGVVVNYSRLFDRLGIAGAARRRQVLRSCVLQLRRKIEPDPLRPEFLLTEIGVGYRLVRPGGDQSGFEPECG